jgi:uncharacterized protein (UPF0212 family)
MEKEQEMYFVQVKEMYNEEGKVIPILPMRLVKNADSFEEAIRIACENILNALKKEKLSKYICTESWHSRLPLCQF